MVVATVVYKKYLASRGLRRMAWSSVRKALVKLLHDPTCALPIHGRCLTLPLSHPLPDFLTQNPYYDRLPRRISEYVHRKQGLLNCIDVGANIGDTLASFYIDDEDIFLAIEPNPRFNELLSENWGWNKNVTVASDICSSSSSDAAFEVREKAGTASLLQTERGIKMSRRTLDEVVDDHPCAAGANVLKVDTDGHDFEVIAGARKVLARNHPVMLFECDAFDNHDYVEDCLRTLDFIKQSGYGNFLLYDNSGYLMGRYALSDLSPFRNLLFYQLTSRFWYFDILVMTDEELLEFYRAEIDYFADKMPNKSLQRTAVAAAGL